MEDHRGEAPAGISQLMEMAKAALNLSGEEFAARIRHFMDRKLADELAAIFATEDPDAARAAAITLIADGMMYATCAALTAVTAGVVRPPGAADRNLNLMAKAFAAHLALYGPIRIPAASLQEASVGVVEVREIPATDDAPEQVEFVLVVAAGGSLDDLMASLDAALNGNGKKVH